MTEEKSGVLLLALSDFKTKRPNANAKVGFFDRLFGKKAVETIEEVDAESYASDNGKIYCGRQTYEAPCYYLMDKALEEGYRISKVICLCSNLVVQKKVYEGKTAADIFEERIKAYSGADNEVEVVRIEYESGNSGFGKGEIADPIFSGIKDALAGCEGSRVYIDYTGGLRDISFLMTTIIRYLEFKEIKTSHVAYSLFSSKPKSIIDITYIYRIMQLINGVEQFASTGNPKALKTFSKDLKLAQANKLMDAMVELSDAITLCRGEKIDELFEEVRESLEEMRNLPDDNELYTTMIREMIPYIEKKLKLDEGVSIPNIIEWCNENALYQQALTVIESKAPSVLCGNYLVFGEEKALDASYLAINTMINNTNSSYENHNASVKGKRSQMSDYQSLKQWERYNTLFENLGYSLIVFESSQGGKGIICDKNYNKDEKKMYYQWYINLAYKGLSENDIPSDDLTDGSYNFKSNGKIYKINYSIPNEVDKAALLRLIRLHITLKSERNQVNHDLGDAQTAYSASDIERGIRIYLELLNKVLSVNVPKPIFKSYRRYVKKK